MSPVKVLTCDIEPTEGTALKMAHGSRRGRIQYKVRKQFVPSKMPARVPQALKAIVQSLSMQLDRHGHKVLDRGTESGKA